MRRTNTSLLLLLSLGLLADNDAPYEPAKSVCPKCKKPLVNMGDGQWVCSLDPEKCREGDL